MCRGSCAVAWLIKEDLSTQPSKGRAGAEVANTDSSFMHRETGSPGVVGLLPALPVEGGGGATAAAATTLAGRADVLTSTPCMAMSCLTMSSRSCTAAVLSAI